MQMKGFYANGMFLILKLFLNLSGQLVKRKDMCGQVKCE